MIPNNNTHIDTKLRYENQQHNATDEKQHNITVCQTTRQQSERQGANIAPSIQARLPFSVARADYPATNQHINHKPKTCQTTRNRGTEENQNDTSQQQQQSTTNIQKGRVIMPKQRTMHNTSTRQSQLHAVEIW
jgi:hypothetical protein